MDESIRAVRDRLSSLVAAVDEVCLAYLFGSRVDGRPGPLSDYDLGVLLERGADGRRIQARLAHQVRRALQVERVDVVLLGEAPIELAYGVISQGEVLYERDVATRVEYEARVLSLYGDYLPVLRRQRDEILRGDDDARRVQRYREALGRTERTLGQIARPPG